MHFLALNTRGHEPYIYRSLDTDHVYVETRCKNKRRKPLGFNLDRIRFLPNIHDFDARNTVQNSYAGAFKQLVFVG